MLPAVQAKAAKILPLVGLARSKQDPIKCGHGALYLYRPAGAKIIRVWPLAAGVCIPVSPAGSFKHMQDSNTPMPLLDTSLPLVSPSSQMFQCAEQCGRRRFLDPVLEDHVQKTLKGGGGPQC